MLVAWWWCLSGNVCSGWICNVQLAVTAAGWLLTYLSCQMTVLYVGTLFTSVYSTVVKPWLLASGCSCDVTLPAAESAGDLARALITPLLCHLHTHKPCTTTTIPQHHACTLTWRLTPCQISDSVNIVTKSFMHLSSPNLEHSFYLRCTKKDSFQQVDWKWYTRMHDH